MTSSIKQFAILGERCSGTNFLEESIKENFHISYTAEFGSKHFFCYNNYVTTKERHEQTLFIGIVRNPIYWLNSFSKELHHVPTKNKVLHNFLFNEFYSVRDPENTTMTHFAEHSGNYLFKNRNIKREEELNEKDFNYFTNQKYKNIFELRKCKNYYLTDIMPKQVRHYILIHHEDLLFNFEDTLAKIQRQFGLKPKHANFVKVNKYKKSDSVSYQGQRQITFSPAIVKTLWNNLDMKQENNLGYFMWDDNAYFRTKREQEKELEQEVEEEELEEEKLEEEELEEEELEEEELEEEELEEDLEEDLEEEELEEDLEEEDLEEEEY